MQPFATVLAPLAHAFLSFAQSAAPVAVTAVWQGIAITAALALCLQFAPRLSATHRFAVWSAGFVVVAGLPFLPALAFSAISANASNSAAASPHAWLQFDSRWTVVVAAVWLLASAARATDLLLHSLRLRRLWRSATPIEPPATSTPGRRFQICTTPRIDRPSVIGFFAPRILIPDWLFARLTSSELDQIVLHESEHLRRGDDWTNLLQKLCLVLFPLNPALWWMERQICKSREMACDEGVIRITHAPRAYAACLTSIAERGLERRTEALSLGAWQRRPELVQRVHSILRGSRTLPPFAARAVLGVLGCGLLAASFELAHSPQLVAFVPARATAPVSSIAAAHEPTGLIDAAYTSDRPRTTNMSQFRAVPAVAKFPASEPASIRASHQRATHTQLASVPIADLRSPAPHARNVIAKLNLNAAQSDLAQQPAPAQPNHGQSEQWLVLTTWEQVETSRPDTRNVADYDTGNAKTDSPTQPSSQAASRITITRLILRVLPAGSESVSKPASKSVQPAAVPIGNGWFVFQL